MFVKSDGIVMISILWKTELKYEHMKNAQEWEQTYYDLTNVSRRANFARSASRKKALGCG
jgi:hypothetical protein